VHGGNNGTTEALRLSSVLEDTKANLECAQKKLAASETSVFRANNALVAERATSEARIKRLLEENAMLKEKTATLSAQCAEAPSPAQKLQYMEEKQALQTLLSTCQQDLLGTSERLSQLTIKHDAMEASYNQIVSDLARTACEHDMQTAAMQEKLRASCNGSASVDSVQSNDSECVSKADMEFAVATAAEAARNEIRGEMEAKLESTESRFAKQEKRLLGELDRATHEINTAREQAKKQEDRLRLAEDFAAMVAPVSGAVDVPQTVPKVHDAAQVAQEDSPAALEYENLLHSLNEHVAALKTDPLSVRKKMRTSAIYDSCKKLGDAVLRGQAAPETYAATADVDTGSERCVHEPQHKLNMDTASFPVGVSLCACGDMGDEKLLRMVHTGTSKPPVAVQTEQGIRINNLVSATQADLKKSLLYHTLMHKFESGVITGVIIDSDGNSTAAPNGCSRT
jgi:hypothetical protein